MPLPVMGNWVVEHNNVYDNNLCRTPRLRGASRPACRRASGSWCWASPTTWSRRTRSRTTISSGSGSSAGVPPPPRATRTATASTTRRSGRSFREQQSDLPEQGERQRREPAAGGHPLSWPRTSPTSPPSRRIGNCFEKNGQLLLLSEEQAPPTGASRPSSLSSSEPDGPSCPDPRRVRYPARGGRVT